MTQRIPVFRKDQRLFLMSDERPLVELMKPLFIPLKSEYFAQFKSGVKTEELRAYGRRWNEDVCVPGRAVILSRGYGKRERLTGRIWRFKRQRGETFGSTYQAAIRAVFGTLDLEIAVISIQLEATK